MNENECPDVVKSMNKLRDVIEKDVLSTFATFNRSILKTNFKRSSKSATSFLFNPNIFLKEFKLPEIPYAIYMMIGREF